MLPVHTVDCQQKTDGYITFEMLAATNISENMQFAKYNSKGKFADLQYPLFVQMFEKFTVMNKIYS